MQNSFSPFNTTSWTLRRWLLVCVCSMAATLILLVVTVALSYRAVQANRDAEAHAIMAGTQLQRYMRGLGELLLSDGSKSARDLIKHSGAAFNATLVALGDDRAAPGAETLVSGAVTAGWEQLNAEATKLLLLKGVSASDEKSMLAYGRLAGQGEDLEKVFTAIESRAIEAARTAERRMVFIGLSGSAVALLLLLAIGHRIFHIVFARIGGEPARAREMALRLVKHDLTVVFDDEERMRGGTLMAALRDIRDSLTLVVKDVRLNAEGVATASSQIASGNADLSVRTDEQANSIQRTAASTEELSATVKQNADNAMQANQLAQGASRVAIKSGEIVSQVILTMNGIDDSSKKIADIISVIEGIAFQTNILALNAAVEAARAGEQGRGFAVVASEVRSLAGRSAEAAKEIKLLISASVERVGQGTALVDQAGTTMCEVVKSIKSLTDIVGEISAASSGQSIGVAQVSAVMSQMGRTTQQNAGLVEESAAAAAGLKGQALRLVRSVAVFKLTGDGVAPA